MSNTTNIPSRKAAVAAAASTSSEDEVVTTPEAPAKKKFDLAGEYRVRDGYHVTHGALDANGRHNTAGPGSTVMLTHDEALSVIRLTKDQRDGEGKSNGPAIETQKAYEARVEAQAAHEEFMKSLAEANSLPE